MEEKRSLDLIEVYDFKECYFDNSLEESDEGLEDDFINCRDSDYICDAIYQIADDSVSYYTSDICNNCYNLYTSGAYEDANRDGYMDGNNDLIRNLEMAWSYYNSSQLYKNLEELVYNYGIKYIVDNNCYLTEEELEEYEEKVGHINNNNRFRDITDIIDDIINSREEDLEEEEE